MRIVVMGVTGCGKSSVGVRIAQRLDAAYADADGFHSEGNVAKMTQGLPLTDEDRWPWLAAVGVWIGDQPEAVMSCSALRRAYRDVLRDHAPDTIFVHLSAPQEFLEERVRARSATTNHFAGAGLLDSQYATLEPLAEDEVGVVVDVSHASVTEAAASALESLGVAP